MTAMTCNVMASRSRRAPGWRVLVFLLASALVEPVLAQAPAPKSGAEVLQGAWVRPDGGYTIVIKGVGPTGLLDAMYFNPNPLPFAKAQATQEGAALRVSLELRAGGYNGSTYELTYDRANDRLAGVYYQAVAKQKFDVHFVRK
ncbi:MAG: hypothetical protein ABI831_07055 [Betaproteobacteria bacterium]